MCIKILQSIALVGALSVSTPDVSAEVRPVMYWIVNRVGGDESKLLQELPKSGAITGQRAFDRLWTTLEPGKSVPQVDFEHYFVAVATTFGFDHLVRVSCSPTGDTDIMAVPKLKGPGPVLVIAVISRNGIETFRGQPLGQPERQPYPKKE